MTSWVGGAAGAEDAEAAGSEKLGCSLTDGGGSAGDRRNAICGHGDSRITIFGAARVERISHSPSVPALSVLTSHCERDDEGTDDVTVVLGVDDAAEIGDQRLAWRGLHRLRV